MRTVHFIKIALYLVCTFFCACQNNQTNLSDSPPTQEQRIAALNARLGIAYLDRGQRKRAKEKLVRALSQEPNSLDANVAMAYFYEKTGQDSIAEHYHKHALEISHRAGAQLNNYGAFLCRTGRYQQSLPYFEEAASDKNYLNTAAAFENAGFCSMALSKTEMAKAYFLKALKIEPKRKKSLRELVNIAKKQEDPVTIVQAAKKEPRAFKRDTTLANALAWANAVNEKGTSK